MSAFLPFARPDIDEQTIAAVGEVLRSGWITSGPQVQRFEEALSVYCDGRPVRAFTCGPEVIQPERSTSPTPAIVASSISGLVNGRKSMVWKKLG